VQVCLVIEIQEGVTWEHWLSIATACETAGLHGLFSSDHYRSVIGYEDRGGTVPEVIDRLHTFRNAGVDKLYLHHPLPDDAEMVTQLGEEIAPAVAAT
jgi:alkanesulfonate monooxygenase SsuD/methylene tetrahydromethanopterin reductase-like flavin-dependent oxidoreductase (luciferase family)